MQRVQVTVDIGNIDILDLKIIGEGIVGTLHIEKASLSFSPPRARTAPKNRITWDKLPDAFANVNGSKP